MSNQMLVEASEVAKMLGISQNIYSALKNSLYPGASDDSIAMVLSYCHAKGYDPLKKPVHLVPMGIKNKETGLYSTRDVVMPGIGSYRIDAERSGCYMGLDEPVFGPTVTTKLGGVDVSYPEWCSIKVKKMVQGQIVEFSAKEFWLENYATSGKGSITPNAMWAKRAFGQLAKVCEAQALRKAFPDVISSEPTAEEMEGKVYEAEVKPKKQQDAIQKVTLECHTEGLPLKSEEFFVNLEAANIEIINAMSLAELKDKYITYFKHMKTEEDRLELEKTKNIRKEELLAAIQGEKNV